MNYLKLESKGFKLNHAHNTKTLLWGKKTIDKKKIFNINKYIFKLKKNMSQYNIIVKFKLVCKSKTTKKLVVFYCLRFHRNTNKKKQLKSINYTHKRKNTV